MTETTANETKRNRGPERKSDQAEDDKARPGRGALKRGKSSAMDSSVHQVLESHPEVCTRRRDNESVDQRVTTTTRRAGVRRAWKSRVTSLAVMEVTHDKRLRQGDGHQRNKRNKPHVNLDYKRTRERTGRSTVWWWCWALKCLELKR